MSYTLTKRLCAALLILVAAVTFTYSDGLIVKDGDTIAFLGDSITAGGAGFGGYCRLVIHGLKTKGIHVKGVFAGVPGNKSSDMLLRLQGDVLDQKPDYVFLSAGVNDIWHADPTVKIGVFQAEPGMGVGLEHYKIYVPQILDRCKEAGAGVILLRAIQSYLEKENVGMEEFCKRAFKVGMYVMRKEDPLGRGSY